MTSKYLQAGGAMYRLCLIAVFLTICLLGCNAPTPEETDQDPNVTPEGFRIIPDVVYGNKFGMALTFDMYQPQNQNGAGVIFINSGGWQSPIGIFYKHTTGGLRLYTRKDLETTKWETITGEIVIVNMSCFNIEPILSKGFTNT
jgi:hypothetical protein